MSAKVTREDMYPHLPWTVRHPMVGFTCHCTEEEANERAREIDKMIMEKAAPELLEALRDIVELASSASEAALMRMAKKAQAAIAKAEGRT